jgi:hypothetical protein
MQASLRNLSDSYYQINLALTWPIRPGETVVTWPNWLLAKLPTGLRKLAWLKILKNSPRTMNEVDSVIFVLLPSPASVLMIPGPWNRLGPEFPMMPGSSVL